MNIKIGHDWLNELAPNSWTPAKLAAELSLRGAGVERIEYLSESLAHLYVGQVLELKKHPNADKLQLVKVDLGKKTIELVCGGTNLYKGMSVVVALVGAKVRWHGEGDLITLQAAEIRGVKSEGMICAANEIGLAAAFPHAEREVMDLTDKKLKPGLPLSVALDLDHPVFDIEVTTNRPDLLSAIGLAREVATITGVKLKLPKLQATSYKLQANLPLKVSVADSKLCPRYQAVVMRNVKVEASPWWLQKKLITAGIRPINNIVDITNYILLLTAQPMHAFDYEKLEAREIVVRMAKNGEKIQALDGNSYNLKDNMLVIADAKHPAAIAGVMGGQNSAITKETTTIVFESANFDPTSVRKTSQSLNLRSDSSMRFEKGLSTYGTADALAMAVELAEELAGAEVASKVYDSKRGAYVPKKYSFPIAGFASYLGVTLKNTEIKKILEQLGFKVKMTAKDLVAEVPWWRDHDIDDGRDLVEEVARIYGYHRLPSTLPVGAPPIAEENKILKLEDKTKNYLKGERFSELYTYSFISETLLQNINWPKSSALRVFNPLSDDFIYMRPTLLPGMLLTIAQNQEEQEAGKFFEVSNIYIKNKSGLPTESSRLVAATYSKDGSERGFYEMKNLVAGLLGELGIHNLEMAQVENLSYHPARVVQLHIGKHIIGWVGQLHPKIAAQSNIDRTVFVAELDLDSLASMSLAQTSYAPVSAYPSVKRDIAFVVSEHTLWQDIEKLISASSGLIKKIELFDTYRGKNLGAGKKSLAVHLLFNAKDRTLEAAEADAVLEKISLALKEKFKAEIRI